MMRSLFFVASVGVASFGVHALNVPTLHVPTSAARACTIVAQAPGTDTEAKIRELAEAEKDVASAEQQVRLHLQAKEEAAAFARREALIGEVDIASAATEVRDLIDTNTEAAEAPDLLDVARAHLAEAEATEPAPLVEFGRTAGKAAATGTAKAALALRTAAVATAEGAATMARKQADVAIEKVQTDLRVRRDALLETPARMRRRASELAEEVSATPGRVSDMALARTARAQSKVLKATDRIIEEATAVPAKIEQTARTALSESLDDAKSQADAVPVKLRELAEHEKGLYKAYPGKLRAWVKYNTALVLNSRMDEANGKLGHVQAKKARLQAQVAASRARLREHVRAAPPTPPPPPTAAEAIKMGMEAQLMKLGSWGKKPVEVEPTIKDKVLRLGKKMAGRE